MGRAAPATSSANRAAAGSPSGPRDSHSPSDSSTPSRNRSASAATSGVGPAEPIPVPTRRRSGSRLIASEHTAMTMALRGPTLANCCGPPATGTCTAATSSSGSRTLRLGPVKNSATGSRREPRTEATSTSASPASSGGRGRAEVAADRPAVADLRRAHRARGDRQPGQDVAESLDDLAVGEARAEPQAATVAIEALQLADPAEVKDRRWPGAIEVQVDHHVGAAGDRQRLWPGRLGLERLAPAPRLEELDGQGPGRREHPAHPHARPASGAPGRTPSPSMTPNGRSVATNTQASLVWP